MLLSLRVGWRDTVTRAPSGPLSTCLKCAMNTEQLAWLCSAEFCDLRHRYSVNICFSLFPLPKTWQHHFRQDNNMTWSQEKKQKNFGLIWLKYGVVPLWCELKHGLSVLDFLLSSASWTSCVSVWKYIPSFRTTVGKDVKLTNWLFSSPLADKTDFQQISNAGASAKAFWWLEIWNEFTN